MLLAVKGRIGGSSCKKVAQDLSRDAAREQLKPLLETACARLASVLARSFDIAVEQEQLTKGEATFQYLMPWAMNVALLLKPDFSVTLRYATSDSIGSVPGPCPTKRIDI